MDFETNIFLIDFSKDKVSLPNPILDWQIEIIDFINVYLNNKQIPVQTSGSTGIPKKFTLPKLAMQKSAKMTEDFLQLSKGDTALLCLPVTYIAGKMMIVRAIEIGLKLTCIPSKTELQYKGKVDFAALVPVQAEKSFELLSKDLHIKKLILGGAKVSEGLESKLNDLESEIFETYGMTETITHIAMRRLNDQEYFHTLKNIKIDKDKNDCLVIKTPYFPELIITNDIVELRNATEFKILGRLDNVINSGGLKICPEELEKKLRPFIINDFIIHSKPDKVLGQKLLLIIEAKDKIYIKYPKSLIPKNKQPKEIIYLDKFPRTESGKIKRNSIKL